MNETRLSYRAVSLRLARSLAREKLYLRTRRADSRWYRENGRHYIVNEKLQIHAHHVDIEKWARERGVIGPEIIVEDEQQQK